MKIPIPAEVEPQLARSEAMWGTIYLPVHMFVLPVILGLYQSLVGETVVSTSFLSSLMYAVGAVWVLLFLNGFLERSFQPLMDYSVWSTATVLVGFVLFLVSTLLISWLVRVWGGVALMPTDELLLEELSRRPEQMAVTMCIIAPFVEETLFRGALFGGALARGRRIAGYITSILLFALSHVWALPTWGYGWSSLLYGFAYVPMGLILASVYETTASIWAAMVLHMLMNIFTVAMLLWK